MGPAEAAATIVVGTFWFWVMVVFVNVVILTAIEYEKGGLATITFLGTLLALQFACGVDVFPYLWAHPLAALAAVGIYAAIGTLWSIGKWWFYCAKQKDRYDDAKEKWFESRGVKDKVLTEELKEEWTAYCNSNGSSARDRGFDMGDTPPRPSNHKGDITMWIVYWPWSVTWTLLNDPIKRLGKWIYRKISGTLEAISARAFAGTEQDLLTDEQMQLRETAREAAREKRDADVGARGGGRGVPYR